MKNSTTSAGALTLRPHQKEAVAAIVRGLSDARDSDLRGMVVMATGTGKTITAAAAAHQLAPHGRCGVLVPTLDLLTQTAEAWRSAGHHGRMIAVCSLADDPLLEELGVRCTTDPAQLTRWTAEERPVVVLATYASLVPQGARGDGAEEGEDRPQKNAQARRGVLERAIRGEGFTGSSLPAFDLLVLDEAHRTSGDLGKSWAAALDQERLPAMRRLFMTATPRLWEAPPTSGGEGRLVASMDNQELYGPVLFELELMEAVERGLLARWEIDVLEITDPHAPGADEASETAEEAQARRLAALQAALLTHLDEVGSRSLLTFHSTTLTAMAMARGMLGTVADLHTSDPARYPDPSLVGAQWLCGEHPAAHRRQVLRRFANGLTDDGWVTDFQVLASCQVLSEGVDIRGPAGVDGVVLADPRSSPIQIVQILGRALRQEPGEGKTARIIVPIYLAPDENPNAMMTSSAYRPLIQVLQGLRAHDARITQRLMLATRTASGSPTAVVELDPGPSERGGSRRDGAEGEASTAGHEEPVDGHEGRGGQEGDQGDGKSAGVPLLRFARPRDPIAIARWLRTRILQPDSAVWLQGYEALCHWVEVHGDAHVPTGAVVDLPCDVAGREEGHALGQWVSEQRRAFADGVMRPHRYQLLEELGMIWNTADARFKNGLSAARAYYKEFCTLAAPRDAVVDGFAVGQWLENLRKGATALTETRDRALRDIDEHWKPSWPLAWQRRYATLAYLLEGEEGPPDVPPGIRVNGIDVGAWLRRQTTPAAWAQLTDGQRELLEKLGVSVSGTDTGAADRQALVAVPGLETLDSFGRGINACRQYLAREGHLAVPRQHEELLHPASPDTTPIANGTPVMVRLGVWLSNTKSRRTKLTSDKLQQLADLGLEWAAM